jgi:hypothetical protein
MAKFTNWIPSSGQTSVPRTSIVGFTVLTDGYGGAQIGTLATTIDGNQAILNGGFVNGYSGSISPSTGKYVVGIYPKSPFLANAAEIPIHLEVLDDYSSLDAYDYSFFTAGYNAPVTVIPTMDAYAGARICDASGPDFPPTEQGLVAALDAGTGTEVDLSWNPAVPSNDTNIVYYNVYYSDVRGSVFDGQPEFLVTDSSTTVGGLCPGNTHYFGVRATEFNPSLISTDGMQAVGPSMFRYPTATLAADVATGDAVVIVDSTDGFPDSGIILFDGELIQYSSVLSDRFIVASRGFAGTLASAHTAGETIIVYRGREDTNLNVVLATPTFQKPNYALGWVKTDGYGNDGYRDGYDGCDKVYDGGPGANSRFDGYDGYFRFRTEIFDSINTDGTNNDNSGEFKRFDYCGTWRAKSPPQFMQGQCDRSYWGGIQVDADGNRVKVPDVRTHMLQREELLLESTGEPFVLVRRMWTGIRCHCAMSRREHAHSRCETCFGTGFVQGYTQFFNPRRPDRRILVRVDPTTEDLSLVDRGGLEPAYEPDAWTIAFPQVKDRDFLIRFTSEGIEEWRYEILNVQRVRAFFGQSGAQKFKMKRIPKTDNFYQFPILRDASPQPATHVTSIETGSGLNAHSHQVIIPEGISLTKVRVATLMSEGHNHIIINGIVQNVIGHRHTLLP